MQKYNAVDQKIHWLSQIIAKTNRTFVPKKDDDSHTNLAFDTLGNRIFGRWITTKKGKRALALNLSTLQFEWLDSSQNVIFSIRTIGKSIQHLERELSEYLQSEGLDTIGLTDKLHFEIPQYDFADGQVTALDPMSLQEWQYYRKLANEKSELVLNHLQINGEVRIWPHHFDTGIYVVPTDRIGIGFGLAMEDSLANAPYFYVAGYAQTGQLSYDDLPSLRAGKWEVNGGWKGAILPLTALEGLNKTAQNQMIDAFLKTVISWYLKY